MNSNQLTQKILLVTAVLFFFPAFAATASGLKPISSDEASKILSSNKPRRLVLSIGINEFHDTFWQKLEFPSKDAKDIHNFFLNKAGHKFDGGELLTSKTSSSGRVTKQNILDAFKRLKANNRSEEDVVIVYLSTHGTIHFKGDSKKEAPSYTPFFVASDTKHDSIRETALEREELIDIFKGLKSLKKALIIATCHSGGGKAQLTPTILAALKRQKGTIPDMAPVVSGVGHLILSASGWSEPAEEDPILKNDVYTHYLIKGMGKKTGLDGVITLGDAHDFATKMTIKHTGGRQHPSIRMNQSGGDPIVIKGNPKLGTAYLYSYLDKFVRYKVVIAGRTKGAGEHRIRIPAGKQRIDIINPKTGKLVVSRVVRFERGKEYSILELLAPKRSNYLEAGAIVHRSMHPVIRREYLPSDAKGVSARYGHEEAFSIFDVGIQIASFSEVSETITLDDGISFKQNRTMLEVALLTGARERVRSLSNQAEGINTEFRWNVGTTGLWISREIVGEDADAFDDPKQSGVIPGLFADAGMVVKFPEKGLRGGMVFNSNLLYPKNSFIDESDTLITSSISSFVGLEW